MMKKMMIKLNNYLEAVNYMVTTGSRFYWKCFGTNVRYLDYEVNGISVSAVYDTVTHDVYKLEVWTNHEYRWINPLYVSAFNKESKSKNLDPKRSIDDGYYRDISLVKILEKIVKITGGRNYLATKTISIEFEEKELLALMKTAHEMDITFNQFVSQAVKRKLDEEQRNHIL